MKNNRPVRMQPLSARGRRLKLETTSRRLAVRIRTRRLVTPPASGPQLASWASIGAQQRRDSARCSDEGTRRRYSLR